MAVESITNPKWMTDVPSMSLSAAFVKPIWDNTVSKSSECDWMVSSSLGGNTARKSSK